MNSQEVLFLGIAVLTIAKFSVELLLLQTCVGLATPLLWCDEVLGMVAPPCGRMKRGLALEQLGMLDACVTLQWCGGLDWLDCYYRCGHMVAPPCALVWLDMLWVYQSS